MTTINGVYHHNVEDILASIRTSIADEAGASRLVSGEIHMPMHHPFQPRRDAQSAAEEAAEFELPAIFKPGHHAAVERPKLLGRLSEALKSSATQEAGQTGRPRTVIPFDPPSANGAANGATNGRMIEPPAELQMAAAVSEPNRYNPQPEPVKTETREVARMMPSFFDTRINKLGEMSRQVNQQQAPEPTPQPQPQHHQPQYQHPQYQMRQPPTLPQGNLAQHPADAVDDAAAQLLRPMLRQWLQENMPKIVEKALLSEAQGDFSPSNPNDPKKPQR